MRRWIAALAVALCVCHAGIPARAGDRGPAPAKSAIVLAAFGSTSPSARAAQNMLVARMQAAFPGVPVRLAITSRTARQAAGPENAPSPLTAMARLADEGYGAIVLQPLLISAGNEYADLVEVARSLSAVKAQGTGKKPFARVVVAAPALGTSPNGDRAALAAAAAALRPEIDQAKAHGQAVVLVAHGNPKRTDKAVANFQKTLRAAYPGQTVLVGGLDAVPGLAEAVKGLKAAKARDVLLLPLLVSAGVHASREICGQEPDAWRATLERNGFTVECRIRGLGELETFADIYVAHARKAFAKLP